MVIEIDDEKFAKVRQEAKVYYQSLKPVWCPYLRGNVHFNSEGFEHLLFKTWNRTRKKVDQYARLRLLPVAEKIIKKSHTLQEYDERRMFVRQKINSRWESRAKLVRYYVFIGIDREKNVRLKVIVKEIEGGVKFFYSLYPSWMVTKEKCSILAIWKPTKQKSTCLQLIMAARGPKPPQVLKGNVA